MGNDSSVVFDYYIENAARRLAKASLALQTESAKIQQIAQIVAECITQGGRILVCGNGGSAACAQHFAAEFTGKLSLDRQPFSAIALTTDTSAITAIGNDYGYSEIFARQVVAHGRKGDVLFGLSTSGSSENVKLAIEKANEIGITSIGLTGRKNLLGANIGLEVSISETARVQEVHDLALHEIAQIAERIALNMDDDASADRYPFLLQGDEILSFISWINRTRQTLVTTNGVFDLFHAGHRHSLFRASQLADRFVVLLNSDESVKRLKGDERPVRTLDVRVEDLKSFPWVDHVIVLEEDDPRDLLEQLRPNVHAKGQEYEAKGLLEADLVLSLGGTIQYIDSLPGQSTTAQVNRMK